VSRRFFTMTGRQPARAHTLSGGNTLGFNHSSQLPALPLACRTVFCIGEAWCLGRS